MSTIGKTFALAALVGVSGAAISINQTTNHGSSHLPMKVQTNPEAPVKASKSIVIEATPETVWSVLTDIDHWANWQPDISKPQLSGPLLPGTTFDWKTGGAGIHSTLHTVEANASLGWTGKTFGMYAVHNWELKAVPGGTEVSVDETMEGLLASLLKKSFNKNLDRDMQHWLELLKAESENQTTPGL